MWVYVLNFYKMTVIARPEDVFYFSHDVTLGFTHDDNLFSSGQSFVTKIFTVHKISLLFHITSVACDLIHKC